MKAPKPGIPTGAPPGKVWFGGPIEWFSITLRISSDDLDPKEVTSLLGCQPDAAERKGDQILGPDGSAVRLAQTGSWRLMLAPTTTDEWDCGEAMMLVMKRLPTDANVWRSLTQRFSVVFFVGLSMDSVNKGFSMSPDVMSYLGARGIRVDFDVYCEDHKKGRTSGCSEPSQSSGR